MIPRMVQLASSRQGGGDVFIQPTKFCGAYPGQACTIVVMDGDAMAYVLESPKEVSALVDSSLRGELGSLDEVNAELASVYFANREC